MHALEMRPDALDWESERHNRILQHDQRAKNDEACNRLQLVDAPVAAPWLDKLQAIPAIRAALIPLDESRDAQAWSKPFSLLKADFEPWLSFYAGYRSSRLFLSSTKREHAVQPELDFPIRALLELKKVEQRLIIEPPVQIDGPVEYFDAERAPLGERGVGVAQSLARAAEAMHSSQLRRAVKRGRDMGNQLHDALLGEGVANLIRAWEKVHQRNPSVHELHIMLTTGRTAPVQPRAPSPTPDLRSVPEVLHVARAAAAASTKSTAAATRTVRLPEPEPPVVQPRPTSTESSQGQEKQPERSFLWYLAHAIGLTCAGALIYLLAA